MTGLSIGDEREIGIICKDCRHVEKKRIGWLRVNTEFLCNRCGRDTELSSQNFVKIY